MPAKPYVRPTVSGSPAMPPTLIPNRMVLGDAVSPKDRSQVAVFAINGPISAATRNFLWFRETRSNSTADRAGQ